MKNEYSLHQQLSSRLNWLSISLLTTKREQKCDAYFTVRFFKKIHFSWFYFAGLWFGQTSCWQMWCHGDQILSSMLYQFYLRFPKCVLFSCITVWSILMKFEKLIFLKVIFLAVVKELFRLRNSTYQMKGSFIQLIHSNFIFKGLDYFRIKELQIQRKIYVRSVKTFSSL